MNERLRQLRKKLNMSQEAFCKKLSLSRSHVSSLENGTRALTDRIVNDICREFGVRETWLRDGIGEMFERPSAALIEELAAQYRLETLDKQIVETYLNLSSSNRRAIRTFVKSLSRAVLAEEVDELESYRSQFVAEQKEPFKAPKNPKR